MQIKNNRLYLKDPSIYEKILISYGLAQDLFLAKTTFTLNNLIKNSKKLALYIQKNGSYKIKKTQIIKILGKIYLMRDSFVFSKGVLDCPKYSYYKSYLSSYEMIKT